MTISGHLELFSDKPVRDFQPDKGLTEAERYAWRIALSWDDAEEGKTFAEVFGPFIQSSACPSVDALLIGDWGQAGQGEDSGPIINELVQARGRLRNLRALFLGEIVMEESEISWINQSDISPLWGAYPGLRELHIRGGNQLSLGDTRHETLRTLAIETGGLPRSVLQELSRARLPQLEHLELWLGDEGYGWDGNIDDLQPILDGKIFPRLRYLGLRNSTISDAIAAAISTSPVLQQIDVLDLSMGTFSDEGAAALAASPAMRRLTLLDVSHHYLSKAGLDQLRSLGIQVRADDPQEGGPDDRYVAVSE